MARKKSLEDLRLQRNRIVDALQERRNSGNYPNDGYLFRNRENDSKRIDRVYSIYDRYYNNIYRTKSTKKAINKMLSYSEGDPNYVKEAKKVFNTKFSKRTYMGTNAG